MSAIRIRKKIDSDTLHLPELGPFIGHTVDILIEDEIVDAAPPAGGVAGTGDWDAVLENARQLTDYDFGAQRDQDNRDIRDTQDRME